MSDGTTKVGLQFVAEGVNEYIDDTNKASSATDEFVGKTSKAADSGKHFKSIGEAAKAGMELVKGALLAGGLAVAGFLATSINTAGDFQKQMSGVQAVLQATPADAAKLRDAALEIGAVTSKSASEAANAFEMLGQNGATTEQILAGLGKQTVSLSEATGGDLVTSANVATTVMNVWGVSAENMGAAIDGITGVTIKSKFGIEDYQQAIAAGGGAAKAFGVSLEDFNTVMTSTSTLFAGGSDAGTSFKTFLTTLVPSSNEAEAAMRQLGLITADGSNQFFDAQGNMKSMSEISGILAEATKGLSEEQKIQTFSTIFGSDAMRTAVGLADTGSAEFDKLSTAIQGTSAVDQAKTRMDNFAGSLEAAKGSLETVQIAVGSVFLPILKQLLDVGIIPLINGAGDLFKAISSGTAPIDAITGVFPELTGATKDAGKVFKWVQDVTDSVWPGIRDTILAVVKIIADFWKTNGADIMKTAKEIFETVAEIVRVMVAIVGELLTQLAQFFKDNGAQIQDIMTAAYVIIKTIIQTGLDTVRGVITAVLALMKGDFNGAWEAIKGIFTTQIDAAVTIVKTLLGDIPGIIVKVGSDAAEKAKQFGTDVTNGVKDMIAAGIDRIKTEAGRIPEAIKSAITGEVDKIKSEASTIGTAIIAGISDAINNGVGNAVSEAKKAAYSILKGFKDALGIKSPSVAFYAAATSTWEGYINGSEDMRATVNDSVAQTANSAVQTASSIIAPSIVTAPATVAQQRPGASNMNIGGNIGVNLSLADGLAQLINATIDQRLTAQNGTSARMSLGRQVYSN